MKNMKIDWTEDWEEHDNIIMEIGQQFMWYNNNNIYTIISVSNGLPVNRVYYSSPGRGGMLSVNKFKKLEKEGIIKLI